MKVYDIRHKDDSKYFLAASGFYSLERAEQWLRDFNPQMWMDKTLRAEDFKIVEGK
jgi:hypothetical protein